MNVFNKTLMVTAIALASLSAKAELIKLDVESAGYTVGNYAYFSVNDTRLVNTTNQRGVNVAVIDQYTGTLLSSARFDTYADSAASSNLTNYINSIEDGRYVMLGVKDEAVNKFFEDARIAIQSLGGSVMNIDGISFRSSYALIGIAGSIVGSRESFEVSSSTVGVSMTDTILVHDIATNQNASSVPLPASLGLLTLSMLGFSARRKSK